MAKKNLKRTMRTTLLEILLVVALLTVTLLVMVVELLATQVLVGMVRRMDAAWKDAGGTRR